jgi:hypothetical protein
VISIDQSSSSISDVTDISYERVGRATGKAASTIVTPMTALQTHLACTAGQVCLIYLQQYGVVRLLMMLRFTDYVYHHNEARTKLSTVVLTAAKPPKIVPNIRAVALSDIGVQLMMLKCL